MTSPDERRLSRVDRVRAARLRFNSHQRMRLEVAGGWLATPGHIRYWVGSRAVMMVIPDCQPRNGMLYGLSSVGNPFQ